MANMDGAFGWKMRSVCRLLAVTARRHEAKGEFSATVKCYRDLFVIATDHGRDRGALGWMIMGASISQGVEAAVDGVFRYAYPEAALADFSRELQALSGRLPRLPQALRGEFANMLFMIDSLTARGPEHLLPGLVGRGPCGSPGEKHGPTPPPPFRKCGEYLTADDLSPCLSHRACPVN